MKKLIFQGLFLALIGTIIISCKKDSLQRNVIQNNENEFGLSTNGTFLIFKTIEDYEKAVDNENPEKRKLLFKILQTLIFDNYFTTNDSNAEMDDFFGKLLSADATIQIGNHIFKIDLSNEKVYAIDSKDKEIDYNNLVMGDISNGSVKEFSTSDDVLYTVKDGIIAKCGGIGSFDVGPSFSDLNGNYFFAMKLFKAGIYFSVKSIGTWTYGPIILNTPTLTYEIASPFVWIKKRPCNSSSVIQHYPGVRGYPDATTTTTSHKKYTHKLYEGTRNINEFYAKWRGILTVNGVQVHTTDWYEKRVNY